MNPLLAILLTAMLPASVLAATPTIVAFGDSTTAPRGQTAVYAALLADELSFEGGDVKVINAGIGGNTTKDATARFENDVLRHKPDVVIMQFGINDSAVDVWKKPPAVGPRVALEDYQHNLAGMIRTLKKSGTRVVLMTSNPISWTQPLKERYGSPPYLPNDTDGMNVLLRDYTGTVRQLAQAEDVGLLDIYTAFKEADQNPTRKPGWLCGDGMHPNNEGHRLVADLLIDHLSAADKRFARKAPH